MKIEEVNKMILELENLKKNSFKKGWRSDQVELLKKAYEAMRKISLDYSLKGKIKHISCELNLENETYWKVINDKDEIKYY